MASTASTLIQRTRRYLRDWKDWDSLSASITSGATTLTVPDGTIYAKRWPIEIDNETMMIRSIASNTLTVERGAFVSTAASHASAAPIIIRPDYYSVEILDALNAGMDSAFPLIYKPVVDTSLTATDSTYEYTLPNMPSTSTPIRMITDISIKIPGDLTYRKLRRWQLLRYGTAPIIKFRSSQPAGSTFRITGYGGFTHLSAVTDTLDAQWPNESEYILPIYAAASLLLSGEAGRVRVDTGATDAREDANRVGASANIGQILMQRFRVELMMSAMPPLPRHVKTIV